MSLRYALGAGLALASFLFRKLTFALFRVLARLDRRPPEVAWQAFSDELLAARPTHFASSMIMGPRWNTNALIGLAGPLELSGPLEVRVASCRASARSWTLVANRFPGLATAGALDALDPEVEGAEWATLGLPPGRYGLALRYYHWADVVELPALRVNGAELVPTRRVSPTVVAVWSHLIERRSWVWRWMNDYVFFLILHADRFSRELVERELLPVGNPRTRFLYGPALAGEILRVRVPRQVLERHAVYLTHYSRDSFPLMWAEIREPSQDLPPCKEDGYYLVRIHAEARASSTETARKDTTAVRRVRVERLASHPARPATNVRA